MKTHESHIWVYRKGNLVTRQHIGCSASPSRCKALWRQARYDLAIYLFFLGGRGNDKLLVQMDLPEVRVLKIELKKREIDITVESTSPYAICSKCGQKAFEFHSYDDPIRLRHLPILEQRVFIELRPKRFRCPTCDDHPTTTQQRDWYEPRSPHTKAFDQSLLRQLINFQCSYLQHWVWPKATKSILNPPACAN